MGVMQQLRACKRVFQFFNGLSCWVGGGLWHLLRESFQGHMKDMGYGQKSSCAVLRPPCDPTVPCQAYIPWDKLLPRAKFRVIWMLISLADPTQPFDVVHDSIQLADVGFIAGRDVAFQRGCVDKSHYSNVPGHSCCRLPSARVSVCTHSEGLEIL